MVVRAPLNDGHWLINDTRELSVNRFCSHMLSESRFFVPDFSACPRQIVYNVNSAFSNSKFALKM